MKETAGHSGKERKSNEDDEEAAEGQKAAHKNKQEEGEVADQPSQDDKTEGKNKEEDEKAANGQNATDEDKQEDSKVAQNKLLEESVKSA